ncbi:MAG: hypothetical protein NZM06_10005 [Chloroherpetonaceae bacterium]|nr:hypothetical protein [Chloroherpetonaceae bacterium]MDW8437716.1 hypothetical protein [Chloroherpetonaceae bacterium]
MNNLRLRYLSSVLSRFGDLKNVLTLIVPKAFGLAANIASTILIVRGLSVEDVGAYTLIAGYYLSILFLSDLGVNLTILRYASKAASVDESLLRLVMRWGCRLKLTATTLTTAFFLLLSPIVAESWGIVQHLSLLQVGLLIGFLSNFPAIPIIYFQAKQAFKTVGYLQFLQSFFALLPIACLSLISMWTLHSVIVATLAGFLMTVIVAFAKLPLSAWWSKEEFSLALRHPRTIWQPSSELNVLKTKTDTLSPTQYLLFVAPSALFYSMLARVDIWTMGLFLSRSEIALYGVAQRVASPLVALTEAVDNSISPVASATVGKEKTKRFLFSSLKTTGIFSVLAAAYALVAPRFLPFLFGQAYSEAALPTSLLCMRFVFTIACAPFIWLSYNFDFAKVQWAFRLCQLVLVTVLNLALLSLIRVYAPVLAWNASEMFWLASVAAFLLLRLRKDD